MSSLNLSNTFLVVVIALILIRIMYRRIKQGLNGRSFKTFRLFTTPVIYFLLLLFFIAAFIGNIDYITVVILLCGIGIIPGFIYGEHVSFFEKDGKIFYKRSPYILTIWASGFMVRILLEFLYPSNLEIQFIVDALLAVTLGLIMGESIKTYIKYREYIEESHLPVY
ncbi:MAG: hypothetical protein AMDU4_FER2C00018G0012 [Ferroplasma sp. Type II]|jgi:membrane protein CcdC involved in cytochrome C biogenesis|uniref:DUF1453 family protein n=1 Tax=Ferroplasma sp. Type II TaxID=261388 RepID=UPI0003895438|nr:DUF1453 family protein [Ferroplasma sp. Type II]EQB74248.1 MAG: hypothetical protein AMDU4_FER2C00018G0012 [Ferroplasma sp. Type II]HIH59819.1 DUF1453 family protein [Ferroplasma sp.]